MSIRIQLLLLTTIVSGFVACSSSKGAAESTAALRPAADVVPAVQADVARFFSRKSGREVVEGLELVATSDPVLPDVNRDAPLRKLRSPVELEKLEAGRSWWARGPQLAWTRIPIEKEDGLARRIELDSAGVLLVTLANSEHVESPRLRLARNGSESSPRDLGDGIDPFAIEGLARGTVDVIVEGMVAGKLRRLATQRAQIVEQEVTEIVIDISPASEPSSKMPLCGTLRIPAEWGAIPFSIDLSVLADKYLLASPPAIRPVEPNLWSWTAGTYKAARYMAFVKPFQTSFVFDYDPLAASNFELAIAPPAQVLVKFVDKDTGTPVTDDWLGWYGMPPREPSSIVPEQVRFDEERGGFFFTAPIGDIVLSLGDADEGIRFEVASIAAGTNEIELKFASFIRVRVFAVQDGRRVPWPEDAFLRAESERRFYPHENDFELGFDQPGTYRIELMSFAIDEEIYEPAAVVVEALRGRIVEAEIPLKRRK